MVDEAIHNHSNAEEQEVEAIQAREQRIERMEQTFEQRLERRLDQRFEELRVMLSALGLRAGQNAEDGRRTYRVVPREEPIVRHVSTNRTLRVDAGPYQDGGYDQVVNYCDSGRFQWDPGDNHPSRIPIFDGRMIEEKISNRNHGNEKEDERPMPIDCKEEKIKKVSKIVESPKKEDDIEVKSELTIESHELPILIVKNSYFEEKFPNVSSVLTFPHMEFEVVVNQDPSIRAIQLYGDYNTQSTSKARGRAFHKWGRMTRRIFSPYLYQQAQV
ncbi:hypothetical protein CRG98_012468 [Punica granatum]|uniref:Uncharacterized protein n=1 Tax=Punica granatum TaxID=22663 RepID=A0A2I0KFR4_PUNGR|nr:hypothetical protein CRG98_012468 [Punica granatum]